MGGGGGTEKTLLAIIEALVEHKHIVSLYTVSKPSIKTSGVKVYSILPFHLPVFGLYQRYLESKLTEKAKDDDLLIQASGGLVLPQNKNQKIIIYCHHDFQKETEKDVTKYKGFWSLYYKPYYALSQKFIGQINHENILLIANSKFTQESLSKKFDKNSTVIYPPVELDIFQNSIDKEQNVITISRYSQEKNIEFAIDVLCNINTKYTIIGNTKTRMNKLYYENLAAKLKRNKTKHEIFLLKNIERSRIIESLKKSKVYFHASPETFGITIIESIAAGCIPIVPNNSAHKETVPFSELRYEPNNTDDAEKKVGEALSGKHDSLLKPLQNSLTIYDKENFKKSFIRYIENI